MRRIAVTGMGIVCPLGIGLEPVWRRLVNGRSGIRVVTGQRPGITLDRPAGDRDVVGVDGFLFHGTLIGPPWWNLKRHFFPSPFALDATGLVAYIIAPREYRAPISRKGAGL